MGIHAQRHHGAIIFSTTPLFICKGKAFWSDDECIDLYTKIFYGKERLAEALGPATRAHGTRRMTPMKVAGLSIVIPVYNSSNILPKLIEQLQSVLISTAEAAEIILVNDGSRDNSWQVISVLARQHSNIRGINMMRNYGQHNALLCGIRTACHDLVVTMDDDLQHPPAEITKMLNELAKGYDVVYGTPEHEEHGLLRDLASRMTKFALQSSMGAQTARNASAFRAFRTRLRDAFADYRSPFICIDVLLTWGTTRFSFVRVNHAPRAHGVSNYTVFKLVTHAFNMMTGFSTKPLQLASLMGFTFALFGFLVLIYVIGRFFILGHSVPGFPFLASIITIFSGAQLLALGIIGEYLARMHFRMMERPTYTVLATTHEMQGEGRT